MNFRLPIVLAALTALMAYCPVATLAAGKADTDYTSTEIIPEYDGFAPGETLWFAVQQRVADGWHVFWRNPGDAGLTLNLDWSLPDGYVSGEIIYPIPEYIPVGPLASYAHVGEPIFLVGVKAPPSANIGNDVEIKLDASWQVCEEICVPEEAQFSFAVPVLAQPTAVPDRVRLFKDARAQAPKPLQEEAIIRRNGESYIFSVAGWREGAVEDIFFFPSLEGLTKPAAPQIANIENDLLTLRLTPGWTQVRNESEIGGVLAYTGHAGKRHGYKVSARIDGSLAPPAAISTDSTQKNTSNVFLLLIFAFVGGLILNVMPCVFPIVFIKAAALMQSVREEGATIRLHGFLYTAGVVSSFILIGGLLLLLRAGGSELGWGFHLQSPIVVGLSAYVLFLVGLNLAGLFTVGESMTGLGQGLTERSGAAGAYFTGVLAVIVAAPCVGPLLTAPLGAALVQPASVGMAIFLAMGLGLAAPYLALSLAPALGRHLPKPGAWMTQFKQALAFPVFGAAAYFVWVFARQTGDSALGVVLGGGVLLALAAWLFQLSKGDGARAMALRGVAVIAAVLAIAPITRISASIERVGVGGDYGAIRAEPYSLAALDKYRAAGTPVFIDFTAAWCVTCQFNKITVLRSREVEQAFVKTGTVLLVADWTVRDPVITDALQSYGASGVPLYVYYAPGAEAQRLPPALSRETLTSVVLERD